MCWNWKQASFRPLWGPSIPQLKFRVFRLANQLFPSPLGTFYSSILPFHPLPIFTGKVSVPFGDLLFLNGNYDNHQYDTSVSVPFGDLLFLNQYPDLVEEAANSFRPLWGPSIPQ